MDWLDPDTWKKPAEILGYWQTIGAAATAFLAMLGGVTKRGRDLACQIAKPVRRLFGASRERADLRFVADDEATFWSVVTLGAGGERQMALHGTFHVTNLAELNVSLIKFRFRRFDTERHMLFTAATAKGAKISPNNVIPAGRIGQVEIHCIIKPLAHKARKPFVADVIFTDNLDDEHRVRSVRFNYRGP